MTDLPAYFDRIGYRGPAEPTLETLHTLVAGHNRTIPFENLDPLMGTPVVDLSEDALTDKLVRRRRGGYCYEQNGLMSYVLAAIGFGVEPLAGRVWWMHTSGRMPAETHQALSVTVPGVDGPWLVDVGFGGQTLPSPIRLEVGPVQQTRHEPYRIRERGDDLLLEALVRDEWQALYTFNIRPHPEIDRQVGSWYVSTYPDSHFVTGLNVALVTDDARWNLRGRNLAIHRADGTERIALRTAADVLATLTERFGIDVADAGARADVEARINAVLDS